MLLTSVGTKEAGEDLSSNYVPTTVFEILGNYDKFTTVAAPLKTLYYRIPMRQFQFARELEKHHDQGHQSKLFIIPLIP